MKAKWIVLVGIMAPAGFVPAWAQVGDGALANADSSAQADSGHARPADSAESAPHLTRKTDDLTLAEFFDSRHSERESDSAINAATKAVIRSAFRKIHRLVIGQTTESRFRSQWDGPASPDAEWLNLVIGLIDSPKTFEARGYRSTTYYIGAESGDFDTKFYWAVTFKNGVLESIYTY